MSSIEGKHEFRLSDKGLHFLKHLVSQENSLADLLVFQAGEDGRKATVRLDRVQAEALKELLTVQLASTGFDGSYTPNEQGQMLEELIDRFFLP